MWKSVSRERYLYLRGSRFYVRRRVPTALRSEFGSEFLIEALGTSDRKEAVRLATYVNQQHQLRLDEAAGRLTPAPNSRKFDDIPIGEIELMVAQWFALGYRAMARLFVSEQREAVETGDTNLDHDPTVRKRNLKANQSLLYLPDHPAHTEILAPAITDLIRKNGLAHRFYDNGGILLRSRLELVADRAGSKYRLFVDLVRRATIELISQELQQLSDGAIAINDPDLRQIVHEPKRGRKVAISLGQLIEEFKGDPRRGTVRRKVELDYGLVFRVLQEVVGFERRLRDVDRDDCKAVRDLLQKMPSNSTKLYPDLTFAEACAKGARDGRPVLSPTTVNSYLVKMSTLFKYGVDEERIGRNPAKSLTIPGHDHSEDDRHPFSDEQLSRIFSAPIFTGCVDDARGWATAGSSRPRGTRFWIPLIALFQGMRLNEICQLQVNDLSDAEGIPVFHIRADEGDKRIKTVSGRRRVPVHSSLLDLGLLDYRDRMRSTEQGRLFPDLKKDSRGYYSDGFQKWFARLVEKQDAAAAKTSFHSFRHNWRNALRDGDFPVPQERVRLIGGWKRTETDERYGSDLRMATVKHDIEKVAYPEVVKLVS